MDGNRKWCPSAWLDEVVPVHVADPSDALFQFRDGRWAIVCDDFRDAKASAPLDDYSIEFVEPGQVIGWCYSEGRGHFTLTIANDGTWSLDEPMPEQVTHWLLDDWETLGDNVPEVIQFGELEAGEHGVMAYYWSNDLPFRFEIEDGRGRLVQVAGAH